MEDKNNIPPKVFKGDGDLIGLNDLEDSYLAKNFMSPMDEIIKETINENPIEAEGTSILEKILQNQKAVRDFKEAVDVNIPEEAFISNADMPFELIEDNAINMNPVKDDFVSPVKEEVSIQENIAPSVEASPIVVPSEELNEVFSTIETETVNNIPKNTTIEVAQFINPTPPQANVNQGINKTVNVTPNNNPAQECYVREAGKLIEPVYSTSRKFENSTINNSTPVISADLNDYISSVLTIMEKPAEPIKKEVNTEKEEVHLSMNEMISAYNMESEVENREKEIDMVFQSIFSSNETDNNVTNHEVDKKSIYANLNKSVTQSVNSEEDLEAKKNDFMSKARYCEDELAKLFK